MFHSYFIINRMFSQELSEKIQCFLDSYSLKKLRVQNKFWKTQKEGGSFGKIYGRKEKTEQRNKVFYGASGFALQNNNDQIRKKLHFFCKNRYSFILELDNETVLW